MLPVKLVFLRIPMSDGSYKQYDEGAGEAIDVWIDPPRVDTITKVTNARREATNIPARVKSIIRYHDSQTGYRLYYLENEPEELARMMWRISHGDDPSDPDFGKIAAGNGF